MNNRNDPNEYRLLARRRWWGIVVRNARQRPSVQVAIVSETRTALPSVPYRFLNEIHRSVDIRFFSRLACVSKDFRNRPIYLDEYRRSYILRLLGPKVLGRHGRRNESDDKQLYWSNGQFLYPSTDDHAQEPACLNESNILRKDVRFAAIPDVGALDLWHRDTPARHQIEDGRRVDRERTRIDRLQDEPTSVGEKRVNHGPLSVAQVVHLCDGGIGSVPLHDGKEAKELGGANGECCPFGLAKNHPPPPFRGSGHVRVQDGPHACEDNEEAAPNDLYCPSYVWFGYPTKSLLGIGCGTIRVDRHLVICGCFRIVALCCTCNDVVFLMSSDGLLSPSKGEESRLVEADPLGSLSILFTLFLSAVRIKRGNATLPNMKEGSNGACKGCYSSY